MARISMNTITERMDTFYWEFTQTQAHTIANWSDRSKNILNWIIRYGFLTALSFLILYPILFALSISLRGLQDVGNNMVQWVPQHPSLSSFEIAMRATNLNFAQNFPVSVRLALVPALLQSLTCGIVGFGLSRKRVPGMGLITALLMVTMVLPDIAMQAGINQMFGGIYLGINSEYRWFLPALFGISVGGPLFTFIYRQYFKGLPYQLEEAAMIDGAGTFRMYWTVLRPQANNITLIVFLFSLVWHWNGYPYAGWATRGWEGNSGLLSGVIGIMNSKATEMANGGGGLSPMESLMAMPFLMASVLLVIAPLILVYVFAQRYFVESVERSGLTGE